MTDYTNSKETRLRILVVDDEQTDRDLAARLLEKKGFNVDQAESGPDALQKMKTTNFHIVVTDLLMPEMTGVELMQAIKRASPATRVIMATGYATMENVLMSMRRGADACVTKPFQPDRLETAVVRAADMIRDWHDTLYDLQGRKAPEQEQ